MILCVKRLHDFSHTHTHSLRWHDLFLRRLRDFFGEEVARFVLITVTTVTLIPNPLSLILIP